MQPLKIYPGDYKKLLGDAVPANLKVLEKNEEEADESDEGAEESASGEKAPALEEPATTEKPEPKRVLEAALFLANKPLALKDLSEVSGLTRNECRKILTELARDYDEEGKAFELVLNEDSAGLKVRGRYLNSVAPLSKKVDLSRKATRILALIAKKKSILQKELPHYFRGEIYAYVAELREAGYIDAAKHKNTRLLKPTARFYESFQLTE